MSGIILKTVIDVARLRGPCRIIESLFMSLSEHVIPGTTTLKLNDYCEKFIEKNRAKPALKGYNNFPSAACISVNHVAAHGVPGDYLVREGDIVSIDVAVQKNGWCGDGAWTYIAGGSRDPDKTRLVKAAWQATCAGIRLSRAGLRFGDLGAVISEKAGEYGCRVIKDFTGHGIGQDLHEEPKVLHFGEPQTGQPIVAGMVFTIEPILSLGEDSLKVLDDGWTQVTRDGSLTAQFEQTIAVFGNRNEVLTMSQLRMEDYPEYPPF
ncbi:MAG: type I methionyl aminopeptidase [Spirochaetales bacterium]|nr:MAG: type I methionyl aminopeptidase [Spirochaetales bacterium]